MKTTALKLFSTLVLILAAITVQAQAQIGVVVGPTASVIYGNDGVEDALDSKAGFAAGGIFQYNFTSTLGIQTGLIFERKGGYDKTVIDFFGNEITTRTHANFDYLTIPVLARASFLPEDGPRLFVNAGPYFGFLMQQQTVVRTTNDDGDSEVNRTKNTDDFKAFDVGISAGIGVTMPVGDRIHLGLEIRDNLGFFNYNENDDDDARLKNNSVNFLFSVMFDLQ